MSRPKAPIDLFRYHDYRTFLRDWYGMAKASRESFSFRHFSQRAGFHSPNYLKMVMDGDRNLTPTSLDQFIIALKLNKQEQEFFRHLVLWNQAKTPQEKDLHYQRLVRSRKYRQIKPMDREHYDYYSSWYHPVIRELAVSQAFDGRPEWLAAKLAPSITPVQAARSLELLERLGFLQKVGEKKWAQAEPLVTTGPEVASLILSNYHRTLLDLTKERLQSIPPDQRDVSALVLGVVRERIPQLKKKIQAFREEILKLVSVDAEPEEVVQLNIQMFPVTQSGGMER